MKKLILPSILILSVSIVYSQSAREKLMPVTTESKQGLSLYRQAKKYFDDVHLPKALETFEKALDEDSDFFMANYQLAFYYLLNRAPDEFKEYSDAAIKCKDKLSDAEELLKEILISLMNGSTNVTNLGNRLVEMYPNDPESYNNLASFQSIAGDIEGMVETLLKAVKIASNPAPFYNQLGYAYITLKQNNKAEESFNKYIESDPGNPNVYDSKGDYFMYNKQYDKAYESYMKAYAMDRSFSRDKAETARRLYEQTEGRKLEIITM